MTSYPNGKPAPATDGQRALQRLHCEWPSRRLPKGAISRVAREVGISRQFVSQLAATNGFEVDGELPAEVAPRDSRSRRALDLLVERYPSRALPRGAIAEVARELEVDATAVTRVARRAGFALATTAGVENLRARYPDRVLPRGEVGRVARDLGLSAAALRQAALRQGFRVGKPPRR